MRLRRLSMRAIGPFAGEYTIDFDQVTASGLYLLDGPTGSGKSTIIDAITWGLYGSVAGGEDSSNDRIRSTHADPSVDSYVDLVFTVGSGTYRVRRTPQWVKPGRKTPIQATAKLWKLDEGALDSGDIEAGHVLETKARDTGIAIGDILGLNKNQFVQTIILPQGKFADFLRLGSAARTDLLEQIFDTSIYRQFAEDLASLAGQAGKKVEAGHQDFSQAVGTLISVLSPEEGPLEGLRAARNQVSEPEDADGLFSLLDEAVEDTEAAAEKAVSECTAAEALLKAAQENLSAQQDLEKNLARRKELLDNQAERREEAPRMDALDGQLTRDQKARQVLPYVKAHEDALQATEDATKQLAQSSTVAAGDINEDVLNALRSRLNDLRSQSGTLAELRAVERSIATEEARQKADATKLKEQQELLEADTAAAGEIPEKLEAARSAKEEAHTLAASAPSVQAALDLATKRSTQFGELQALREKVSQAEAKAKEHAQAVERSQDELRQVTDAWVASTAANLALELSPGSPCPVCGSVDHPGPAQSSETSATRDDVDLTTAAFNKQKSLFDKAANQLESLRGRASVMEEENGDATAEALDKAIEEAREALQAATNAGRDEAKHAALVDELVQKQETLRAKISEGASQISALESAIAQRKETIATHTERVEKERDGYSSVAERLDALTQKITDADTEASAVQAVLNARADERKQREDLDQALSSSEFETAAQVRQSLVNPEDAATWKDQISRHRDGLRDIAKELESDPLASLAGDEEPEVGAAQEAHDAANLAADKARRAASDAQSLASQSKRRMSEVISSRASWQKIKDSAGPIVRLSGLANGSRKYSRTGIPLATYVLQQRFEHVVQRANEHLAEISLGRYELQTTEEKESGTRQQKVGLGLQVLDHSGESGGDSIRATRTLSGGETFYVALTLALALADVVCAENGGIQLDTLMIDEGFGSLDESTLDQVMQLLTGLASGGRAVALVSHVSEMKKMVPEQITVLPQPDGSSRLEVHA
ncbi:AAA family ATPase [Ancrocorticia populi]|uniref:Nuclease SbcCD subunit C n=1 Tax=Ancrocorticia populi TaxID=2175228 RepID=A0A2V1K8Z8_9ACTO|nr:SMC family ATPase [Ancrocorticia populi]PWF25904.1 hypothetical protein DD236_07280 [Ancrocorticia populi]